MADLIREFLSENGDLASSRKRHEENPGLVGFGSASSVRHVGFDVSVEGQAD